MAADSIRTAAEVVAAAVAGIHHTAAAVVRLLAESLVVVVATSPEVVLLDKGVLPRLPRGYTIMSLESGYGSRKATSAELTTQAVAAAVAKRQGGVDH